MSNRAQNKLSGFSLIEILVVLVIMGLLISVVAPTVLNSADDARIQKVQADFKSIEHGFIEMHITYARHFTVLSWYSSILLQKKLIRVP